MADDFFILQTTLALSTLELANLIQKKIMSHFSNGLAYWLRYAYFDIKKAIVLGITHVRVSA